MELVSTNNLQESGKERKRAEKRRGERREGREGKEARKEVERQGGNKKKRGNASA